MAKKLILAVAGAGKTYTICNQINEMKRNLIIAYTHRNIQNIENELMNRFGYIPSNTNVLTFHAFILRYIIKPYEQDIALYYNVTRFKSQGITFIEPPPPSILCGGYRRSNPYYHKDNNIEHYLKDSKYYSSLLSKLIVKTNNKSYKLCELAMQNINMFVDNIYIDEFQDFRNYDYSLIEKIIKHSNSIYLVADYYQHSVNALNNNGKPFGKRGKESISYAEYISLMKNLGLDVDNTSLIRSRRCSKQVCDFVRSKLKINIEHLEDNSVTSEIKLLSDIEEINKILCDKNCFKLVYKESYKYGFTGVNWSYSKGDTYPNVCIILTDKLKNICKSSFDVSQITTQTLNQIYVAITRTKGNLYFICSSDFKQCCTRHNHFSN